MPPYKFKFSTIKCLACEIFHKVMENVQMLKMEFEQEDWMLDGSCAYSETDLFFPVGSSMKAMKQANEAKAICRECPVVTECLEYAIRTNQDSGIWGGTTEDERKSIRRQYRKTGLVITG